jgi:hypothetical protein
MESIQRALSRCISYRATHARTVTSIGSAAFGSFLAKWYPRPGSGLQVVSKQCSQEYSNDTELQF